MDRCKLSFVILALAFSFSPAVAYQRPSSAGKVISVPLAADADGLTPQQVHVSLVGSDRMRVTWITDDDGPSVVDYGTSSGRYSHSAVGSASSYSYLLYRSGQIHDVVIGPLSPSTVYYYRCGSNPAREFSFKTPPSSFPLNFVVVGEHGAV